MLGPKVIDSVDGAGLWKQYRDWPMAAKRALDQKINVPKGVRPNVVVLAGMGGSGAACDVAADWLSVNSEAPVTVVKDYTLPRFADKRTLLVIVSLSGDTKEVLSLMDQARDRGCPVVGVSSGGRVEEICRDRGIPHNRVERMLVPRASIPGMVLVTLRILAELGLVDANGELGGVVSSLRNAFSEIGPVRPLDGNPAKKMAMALSERRGAIYAPAQMASVAHHFQASMNENAKVPVYSGTYPEVFHNEVETWREGFGRCVVLLRQGKERAEVSKRLGRSKVLLARAKIPVFELKEDGPLLSSLLSACLILDMVSIYLAVLRGISPIKTPLLDGTRIL